MANDNRIRYKFFNLEHLLLYINNIQIQLNINTQKLQSFLIIRKTTKNNNMKCTYRHILRKHVAFLSADYRECNQVTIGWWLTWCELVNVAIHTQHSLWNIHKNKMGYESN
jgi:hypothetical protein